MAINYHPEQGTILACDFRGSESPEMTKKRPVVVVSPRFRTRGDLCTVVPLSTSEPRPVTPYHFRLRTAPPLPAPYLEEYHWVKADMLCTVSFSRLFLLSPGKDDRGTRIYDARLISEHDLRAIQAAVLHGIGLGRLTEHL